MLILNLTILSQRNVNVGFNYTMSENSLNGCVCVLYLNICLPDAKRKCFCSTFNARSDEIKSGGCTYMRNIECNNLARKMFNFLIYLYLLDEMLLNRNSLKLVTNCIILLPVRNFNNSNIIQFIKIYKTISNVYIFNLRIAKHFFNI